MSVSAEVLKMIALGLAAGICSGMFGIGGGLIIVPALVLIFGFDIKTAIGTSLFVILLPTGLLGVWEYWKIGQLKVSAGFWIAFGVFCGAYLGAMLAGAVSAAGDEAALRHVSLDRRDLFPADPGRGNPAHDRACAAPCARKHFGQWRAIGTAQREVLSANCNLH